MLDALPESAFDDPCVCLAYDGDPHERGEGQCHRERRETALPNGRPLRTERDA